MIKLRNILELPKTLEEKEFVELIAEGDARIERIISTGHVTPVDEWYDQDNDEWVLMLDGEATLMFEETGEVIIKKGDYILIKAHEKHRVEYTSTTPPCIWLAIHTNLSLM